MNKTVLIPATVAIVLIQSIVIRLDDEGYCLVKSDGDLGSELDSWALLYNTLSDEQKAEVENGLPECYRINSYGGISHNVLYQLKHYAETGENIKP